MLKRLLPSIILALGLIGAAYAVNITGTNSSNENSIVKMGYERLSVTDAITAFAGGGQTSAVQLVSAFNRVTVVGTAADSVKLPLCSTGVGTSFGPGTMVWVSNADASDSLNVFPATGDAINLLSANTAFPIPAVRSATFVCVAAGTWQSIISS